MNYLDTAEILSQINRKFYRQGYEYVFENIEMFSQISSTDPDSTDVVLIQRLPAHWPCQNAWKMAFSNWRNQQQSELHKADTEDTIGHYNDFKIFMDSDHSSAGEGANLRDMTYLTLAQAQALDPAATMEWGYSEVVIPNEDGVAGDTAEYHLHMIGDDSADSKAMIFNYAKARSRPHQTDPNVVAGEMGLYADMQDVGEITEEIIDNARYIGNQPPYLITDSTHADPATVGMEFYPGGSAFSTIQNGELTLVDYLIARSGPGALATDQTGPFSAFCGLLKIWNLSEQDVVLKITLAPGGYKGVMARPMQDV